MPEEALFCHKCGKPQREILAAEPEPAPAPTPVYVVVEQPRADGFKLRQAILLALPVAAGATMLFFLPFVNWIGGGFVTVLWYRKRTGERINVAAGMRMGWITGLMMFAMVALFIGGFAALMHSMGGVAAVQAQFKSAIDANTVEALKMIENDLSKALVVYFLVINLLSAAGGAIGAAMGRE